MAEQDLAGRTQQPAAPAHVLPAEDRRDLLLQHGQDQDAVVQDMGDTRYVDGVGFVALARTRSTDSPFDRQAIISTPWDVTTRRASRSLPWTA